MVGEESCARLNGITASQERAACFHKMCDTFIVLLTRTAHYAYVLTINGSFMATQRNGSQRVRF